MTEEERESYLQHAKRRALAYLDRGDVSSALASMMKDLLEHEEFKGIASKLTPLGLSIAIDKNISEARRFIVGFR